MTYFRIYVHATAPRSRGVGGYAWSIRSGSENLLEVGSGSGGSAEETADSAHVKAIVDALAYGESDGRWARATIDLVVPRRSVRDGYGRMREWRAFSWERRNGQPVANREIWRSLLAGVDLLEAAGGAIGRVIGDDNDLTDVDRSILAGLAHKASGEEASVSVVVAGFGYVEAEPDPDVSVVGATENVPAAGGAPVVPASDVSGLSFSEIRSWMRACEARLAEMNASRDILAKRWRDEALAEGFTPEEVLGFDDRCAIGDAVGLGDRFALENIMGLGDTPAGSLSHARDVEATEKAA